MTNIKRKGSPEQLLGLVEEKLDTISVPSGITTAASTEPSYDEVVDWLAEHGQAYEDILDHFGAADIEEIDYDDIIDWIYDHERLSEDFEQHFGYIIDGSNIGGCDEPVTINGAEEDSQLTEDYLDTVHEFVEDNAGPDVESIVWDSTDDSIIAIVNTGYTRGEVGIDGNPNVDWIEEITYGPEDLSDDPIDTSADIVNDIQKMVDDPESWIAEH